MYCHFSLIAPEVVEVVEEEEEESSLPINWNVASNKMRLWWPTDIKCGPPSKSMSEADQCQIIESWCAANATVRAPLAIVKSGWSCHAVGLGAGDVFQC